MRTIGPRRIPLAIVAIVSVAAGVRAADAPVTLEQDQGVLQNEHLRVSVDVKTGTLTVDDKAAGHTWRQPAKDAKSARPLSNVRKVEGGAPGIVFDAGFGWNRAEKKPWMLQVKLTLAPGSRDLHVEADMAARQTEIENVAFLDPLVLDTPGAAAVVADYSSGHLYPLTQKPVAERWFSVSRLDMPWIGVCDLDKGFGYAILVETTDDAFLQLRKLKMGDRELAAPVLGWTPSKKQFAYPRRAIYHFTAKGGYVALAKRYRAYAKEHGLVVPFAEKLKKNPNLDRLFGAPDVWGDASLRFAREAKAAGVEKMIIHGRSSPADMKAINELGYLTSEYDNYTDVTPVEKGKDVDALHDHLPDAAVLKADGQRMTAWLTFDKKTQFMKRCPALWMPAAEKVVSKALSTHPYLGRFIDVTTAEDLYECYDPKHPLTRADKRACGEKLLAYVRSRGLVTGGEHGIWWSVPHLDYIEGMMSGGSYSWPAGHLIHPKTKDQEFTSPWGEKLGKWEAYAKWGIGHENRVPLWDLVFHDCVVSTWYWGDSSDFLLDAAPEITPKKDAFNVLYGTIPILWANREGSWRKDRSVFLRTYRNTGKLHEAIAGAEMLDHEFLTPDRAVQRTRFSDGTEVVVNFGAKAYSAEVGGKRYELPQNGFAVKGPKIEQSLALVGGRPVTTIRTPSFQYSDAK